MSWEGEMSIKEIIDFLSEYDKDRLVENGWYNCCSYRGYYQCLAVEKADFPVTTEAMINTLRDAIGKTFTGYKGGEFLMDEDAGVFYAEYGRTGPPITKPFLKTLLGEDITLGDFL